MPALGEKIRALRMERGLTQQDLAAGLVSTSMISQIESGKAVPSPSLLTHIAERLGVETEWFAADYAEHSDVTHTYRQAKSHLNHGRLEEAADLLESLIAQPSLPPQLREDSLYDDLGECYEQMGEVDKAVSCYEHVATVALARDDIATVVRTYHKLAQLYKRDNQPGLARVYWVRACETLRRHPGIAVPLLSKVEMNLGRLELSAGRYGSALAYYEAAKEHCAFGAAPLDRALIYHGLAYALAAHRRFEEALAFTEQAIEAYQSVNYSRGTAQCRLNIGVLLRMQGRYDAARDHFSRCLSDPDTLGDTARLANLFTERGFCRLKTNDVEGALADAGEALRRSRNHPRLQIFAHLLCANAWLQLQAFDRALEHADTALGLAAGSPEYQSAGLALRQIKHQALTGTGKHADALAVALSCCEEALSALPGGLIFPEK